MKIKTTFIYILSAISFLACAKFAGFALAQTDNDLFKKNYKYVNQYIGMRIEGPRGWYGAKQVYSSGGKPRYKNFPPNAKVFYKKNHGTSEGLGSFNPMFAIEILSSEGVTSSLEALKSYLQGVAPMYFLTKPTLVTIKDKEWAVSEHSVAKETGENVVSMIKKTYLLIHEEHKIVVWATGLEDDYEYDKEIFDEAVSRMRFSDNYLDLM